MSPAADIVILGAGIVGAACARECAARGLKTLVIDSGIVGGGATAAGMGHIVVMDDSPAQLALTRFSQQLWRALAPELPAEVEFASCGTLWVAEDSEEMEEVRRKHALYASAGIAAEMLDSLALAEAEPQLRRPLAGALLVPTDGVLYPPSAAVFLMRSAIAAGARLRSGEKVISAGNGCVRLASGEELHASRIVIACGADSVALAPGLPIRKRKGHLVITDRYPGFIRHQLVELGYLRSAHSVAADSVAFNAQPRKTGQILIGSSREFGSEDASIHHALLGAMVARAQQYLPRLAGLDAIRVWTGFRAATPDKLPLIGPWPKDESLFLATGHEGLGITTSLATARLLAALLLGENPAIPAEPYLPARFLSGHDPEHTVFAHAPEQSHA